MAGYMKGAKGMRKPPPKEAPKDKKPPEAEAKAPSKDGKSPPAAKAPAASPKAGPPGANPVPEKKERKSVTIREAANGYVVSKMTDTGMEDIVAMNLQEAQTIAAKCLAGEHEYGEAKPPAGVTAPAAPTAPPAKA